MQKRSTAYQAVISITRNAHERGRGVAYQYLVELVALFVPEEQGVAYRLKKLRTTPDETYTETATKGTRDIARKLIDAARRQNLVLYGEAPDAPQGDTGWRLVYWRRPARSGGRYGVPEVTAEDTAHEDFMRNHYAGRGER